MNMHLLKAAIEDIAYLRNLYLNENNFQIRYHAYHQRGWTDSYLIFHENQQIGYASVKGNESLTARDTVFEFFVLPPFRNIAAAAFEELLRASNAVFIECQSNDVIATSMLYQFAQNINSNVILFKDISSSLLQPQGILFRKRKEDDVVFDHHLEPTGDFVLEWNNIVIATGGYLLHYNFPFADVYMEVLENHRGKGYGSYLVQEIKKQCYLAGRIPAARCNTDNTASKATLIKAGFGVAGFMLFGNVKTL